MNFEDSRGSPTLYEISESNDQSNASPVRLVSKDDESIKRFSFKSKVSAIYNVSEPNTDREVYLNAINPSRENYQAN